MVEHTSLQPQHILVLEMGMPWLHVLGSLLRCVFPFWLLINIKMISFGISLFYHSHASHKFCRIWSLYNFTQQVYMEQVALSQKVCSLSSICYFCMPFFSTLQAPCPIKLECSVFHFLIFIFGIFRISW